MISHRSRLASTCAALVASLSLACIAPQRPDDVLVLASGADLESANPLVTTHTLARQIQRYALLVTLTRYDSALVHQPYYARRWSWSGDRRTLTMALAGDLRWHDGAPTTARDAAFTLLAARDPATGFPRAAELASLDTAVAADDTTLLLRFGTAIADLPPYLAELPLAPAHLLASLPRSALRTAPFNDTPVGNGPFVFASRRRGARWTFVRNERFPASLGGPPALRGLTVAVVDEATTKFAGLASGELDMAGISPMMVALARRDATLDVLTYPVLFGTALFFNSTRPPFDDARVRLAASRAIDRARIVEVALAGFGTPWSGPVPPGNPLAWSPRAAHDTAAADSLLDAAGWRRGADGIRRRGGMALAVELLTVGSGDNVAEQLLQGDLAARGIAVRVRQTEMGAFLTTARAESKQFDMLIAGVPGDLSLAYVSALFDTRQRGGTLDYTGFHTPALDTLLRAAGASPEGAARRDAWIAVQRALDSLAPATWIYHARGVQGVSRRVRGATMDLRGELVTVHGWSLRARRIVTLLLDPDTLNGRRAIARGSLAPLAQGLRMELAPVLAGAIEIPRDKALLSRAGGRCPHDGTLLRFDPLDARHVCPACHREVSSALHDRFRPYWYQLWLAERVLHAAVLGVLLDDAQCIDAAWRVLDGYADAYLDYPNRDNVLGPSRPFFSTYLESIWLLQLVLAVDLLESSSHSAQRGARVRDRIVEPSVRLIASYDEGISNRQVWNGAAMLAAGVLLGDARLIDHAIDGASGLRELLSSALLADGSWYEGENYHLFAHRGLWYLVTLAERIGRPPEASLGRRFDDGFAAPFRTLLPDLTYPSRRDSQYAVSVRQPRFAESCELGLARHDDPRLVGMLALLYDPAMPARETGRRASTADVERNLSATGLTRADLSWRSLLFARASLPPLLPHPLVSDLLPSQGFAILRRDAGRCFVGLDYGRSGGGHGHPDRLNLLLSDGDIRWFDDPGTGSYVDASLHWYRSTLAHAAPLVDGRSQPRIDGELAAFDDRGTSGWMRARAELAPGCVVQRTVVVMEDYLVDRVEWESDDVHEVALPLHGVHVVAPEGEPIAGEAGAIEGAAGREDGFAFLSGARRLPVAQTARLTSSAGRAVGAGLRGWVATSEPAAWWSAVAPGPPGHAPQPLVLVRVSAPRGSITGVWSWRGAVDATDVDGDVVTVTRTDAAVHVHRPRRNAWEIEQASTSLGVIELGVGPAADNRRTPSDPERGRAERVQRPTVHSFPLRRELAESSYRRSEQSWEEAGRPTAVVSLERSADRLVVRVDVPRAERRFVAIDAANPFDNDPAAIHGDGVQLYVAAGESSAGWLLVPIPDSTRVAHRTAEGWSDALPLDATWQPSADGYALVATVTLPRRISAIDVDVLVNESATGRDRRRGQLVLSGARGEFVYLRADRHERERLLRFAVGDV